MPSFCTSWPPRWAATCLATLALLAALVLGGSCLPAAAQGTTIDLKADSIAFYFDRFLLEADGHVQARMSDGTVISGRAFSMDLRLNRFVIAGDVTLTAAGKIYPGAGFADFLDFNRQYFVPIQETPDRWTFLDADYTKPLPGREMPGDAFALPDISTDRPFIYAKAAEITPKDFVLFRTARVYAGGAWIPVPRYFQTFSSNSYFAQNSLAGATISVPLPINGSRTSETAFLLRYDPTNHAYLSFEQHIVSPNSYLVGSINPITRPSKQYNLLGFTHTRLTQFRAFYQESVYQPAFYRPLVASQYINLQPAYAMKNSFFQYNVDLNNLSLLSQPINQEGVGGAYYIPYNGGRYYWNGAHPNDSQLTWQGFDHPLLHHLPISFRLRSGVGTAYDSVSPLGTIPYRYVSTFTHFVGLTLYTSSIKVAKDTFFTGSFDAQRLWYSQPHYAEQQLTTLSLSRIYGRRLALYVAYRITNQGDIWGGNYQSVLYPVTIPFGTETQTGLAYPSYAAFTGKATQRAVVGSLAFTPNPNFALTLTMQRDKDFPQPIPGFYGIPPYTATGDVRVRLQKHLSVDFQRSYFFHFGTQNWSPQSLIQFGP